MKHLNRILLTLALIGMAGPALADPATLIISALGVSASGVAAFGIRIGVAVAMTALSSALTAGSANRNRAPGGITLRSVTAGEQTPQSFILGRYVTAGNLSAPEMSHGVGGDTRYLTRVYDLSDIQVDGLDSLIIDGVPCSLATGSPSTLTMTAGDGTTPAIHPDYGPTVNKGDFIGFAWCRFRNGSQTTVDPMLSDKYGSYPQRPWQSGMVGRGVAQAIMTFLWRDSPQVWQGSPDVRFVVRGIRLYDPRLDSTAGGSGAHRYGTTSTHEWSDNPVVMIYNLLRGVQILGGAVYGGGFTAADLPYATWAAAMNACDVMIGSRKTYTAGLEVLMGGSDAGGQSPADVVEELLKACAGQITDVGGRILIRVGAPGLPVKFITDDDIFIDEPQELDPFFAAEDSYNTVHATWVDPQQLWTVREASRRVDADAVSADGQSLVADLALAAVTDGRQVQQLTAALLKDATRQRRQTITIPAEGILLNPLDVIDWTSTRNGYIGKAFEIGQVGIDPATLATTLALREVDPDDYNWVVGDEIDVTAPSVEPVLPSAVGVPGFAVTAYTIRDGAARDRRPALRLQWNTPLPAVTAVRWQVRLSGDSSIVAEGATANVDQGFQVVSDGILPGVGYQARARLVGPRLTAWTSWTTVTAPNVGLTDPDFSGGSVYEYLKAAGLVVPEIGATLPSSGNFAGRLFFRTTDAKLYRHTGSPLGGTSGWTKAVDGADLIANTVTAGAILTGTLIRPLFAAGELQASLYPARMEFITASDASWSPKLNGLMQVWCFGAGGGGGACGDDDQPSVGTGGGAGGLSIGFVPQASTGQTYALTVGSGGPGGNPGNADGPADGTNGGQTNFFGNGFLFRAFGGQGGLGRRNITTNVPGGSGGTAEGGSYNYTGGKGGDVDLTAGGHRALASGGGAPNAATGTTQINATNLVEAGVDTLNGSLDRVGGRSVSSSFSTDLEVSGFPMRGYDTFIGGSGGARSPSSGGTFGGTSGALGCGGGGGAVRRVSPNGSWARGGAGGDGLIVVIYYRVGNFV